MVVSQAIQKPGLADLPTIDALAQYKDIPFSSRSKDRKMAIFDLEKDDLKRLTETQLEELVLRLSEADVSQAGHSPVYVHGSGSINAPDGGVDVHVQVPTGDLETDFLVRPDTAFQVKKSAMPRAKIKKEMTPKGMLLPVISHQAKIGGGYVIVSLDDDCSKKKREERIDAMRYALKDDPYHDNIHLDFFDRSKLYQWLRQHLSVMIWVEDNLGQGHSGWRPYGAWSDPPSGSKDELIFAPGVSITLPLDQGIKSSIEQSQGARLSIEEAINPIRSLIRATKKAIRIIGLSGVGKTRIVQSLFDETIGEGALDRTIAIYADTGANPDPSANDMLKRVLAENRQVIMIIDNCSAELHSSLARRVSASNSNVKLITVEYDIREDNPQITEVVKIEADGPGLAEKLLLCRFHEIGPINAKRIAEFADGNARVALAVAERVNVGESLAKLSDAQLFDRLFEQRNQPDKEFREHAEILSLVYSFSIEDSDEEIDELGVLAEISESTRNRLFRSVSQLLDRKVAQKRAHWRAILPQVIANKLAASALKSIPVKFLGNIFELPGRERLLMSFAHRLGFMHDHPVAKEIVEAWLHPDGLLGRISSLNERKQRMLEYIAPVAPKSLLDLIEAEIDDDDFQGMDPSYNKRRTVILRFLQLLAYEADNFDRCLNLLLRIADFEDETNGYDPVRYKITGFFRPYLSETHASLKKRLNVLRNCIESGNEKRRSLGLKMLSVALSGPPWTGSGTNEFGAHPRDFGYWPNHDQFVEWRSIFIDVSVNYGNTEDPNLAESARSVLAQEFRNLWFHEAIRDRLVGAIRILHRHKYWGEGWKAIRSTIYFDYKKKELKENPEPIPDSLTALEAELRPHDLLSKIDAYVLSKGCDFLIFDDEFDGNESEKHQKSLRRIEAKAEKLGEDFAISGKEISILGSDLYSLGNASRKIAFGRGLAKGVNDHDTLWRDLVMRLEGSGEESPDCSVLQGFIKGVALDDREKATEFLDQSAKHPLLRQLTWMHLGKKSTVADLDRCMEALRHAESADMRYSSIFWWVIYADLPHSRIVDLAKRLLEKPDGDEVILEGLSMKLRDTDSSVDALGEDLRRIGLIAATRCLSRKYNNPSESVDPGTEYAMKEVVGAALRFEDNDQEKITWLDEIFTIADKNHGLLYAFKGAIKAAAGMMPEEFLDRVFVDDEKSREARCLFIRQGKSADLPLAKIGIRTLIEWCERKTRPEVWTVMASGVNLWVTDDDDKSVALSDDAIAFLEAVPDAGAVLDIYVDRLKCRSWVGSRADMMQPKIDAIGVLTKHPNSEIAAAARSIVAELSKFIDDERERERRHDRERERRFE